MRRMSGGKEARELSVRIISATLTKGTSQLGSTVERMGRTIIALAVPTIDVLRFGEDQMTTNGTLFKGEVPMTHLVLRLKLRKKGRDDGERGTLSAEVGAIVGGRGRGVGWVGWDLEKRLFRRFKFEISECHLVGFRRANTHIPRRRRALFTKFRAREDPHT